MRNFSDNFGAISTAARLSRFICGELHGQGRSPPLARATVEIARFGCNGFWLTGLLNQKSSEFLSCVAIIFFILYSGHGIVNLAAILVSSRIIFGVAY